MDTARKEEVSAARMTWPEIKQAFPDCWVVLGSLDQDEVTLEIHSAVVRGVSKKSREAFELADVKVGESVAHLFTGRARNPHRW